MTKQVLGRDVSTVKPTSNSKKARDLEKHLRGLGFDRRHNESEWFRARKVWRENRNSRRLKEVKRDE